jgi:DNA-binding CsgD family transcriptional regulator
MLKHLLSFHRTTLIMLFWLLIFINEATGQYSTFGVPFVRNFTSLDYRAGLQNFSIGQGSNGLLYAGNNYGLLEYDGENWKLYGVPSGTKVRSVAVDAQGRVYAGSQGDFGYFEANESGQLVYRSLAKDLPEAYQNFDEVWNVYLDQDRVFFCTFSRIYIYSGEKLSIVDSEAQLGHAFLVNGQLIVNRRFSGLSKLENQKLIPLEDGGFFGSERLSSVHPFPEGGLIISTFQNGIFRLVDGKVSPWNEAWQSLFINAGINSMIRLSDGRFAAGTQNEGLILLDETGGLLRKFNRGQGLENRTILTLFEDREQNLWAGQNNTIARIQISSPFTLIQESSGIRGTGYSAWATGGRLFLGTNSGLFKKDPAEDSFSFIPNTDGQVYNLSNIDGQLFLSHHRGAFIIENANSGLISSTEGSWTFLKLSEDRLIEGTYTGLQLYEKINGVWKLSGPIEGFRESARVMARDQEGFLWVTHGYKGAFRIKLSEDGRTAEQVSFYGNQKGFPTNRLINVYQIRNELFFTSEYGVFNYDKETDRFVPDKIFTPILGSGVQIWMIREDHAGNIYFVGKNHIGILKKNATGEYGLEQQSFLRIRKYLNDDLLNLSIIGTNQLAITAKDGFIFYDGSIPERPNVPFQVLIREVITHQQKDSVLLFGTPWQMKNNGAEPMLDFASNNIRFSFAATTFLGESGDISYQYKLEGFDREWSEWSNQAVKEYTNLRENKYVFKIRARNIVGEIAEGESYPFTILPPWYRTTLAYLLYLIFSVSFLYVSYKIMNRRYRHERRLLSIRQKRELNRTQSKLKELSIQSESRINTLENEKLESEIGHMKTELATATMHLLNKNEVMASIKTQLSVLATDSRPEKIKQELSQLSRVIEDNLTRDDDWEQFRFRFDRVHGDFTRRMMEACPSLTPQEIKLCAYLRLNLSTKEIANLMNISVRGVEISRYRLRKKLGLNRNVNLQDHILHF